MSKWKRIVAIFICVSIISTSSLFNPKAYAVWGVADIGVDIPNTMVGVYNSIGNWGGTISTWMSRFDNIKKTILLPLLKVASIIVVQKAVQALIGKGDDKGGSLIISNYEDYLYLSPKQRALNKMNSFFNTSTRKSRSGVNDGTNNKYPDYLLEQAIKQINSDGKTCSVSIQSYASNPNKLFSDANMKGLMSFLDECNNPYTFSTVAKNKFAEFYTVEQNIASREEKNGYLPKKQNGMIISPASVAENALNQVDQMGNQMIVNATEYSELMAGAVISIGSRTLAYGIGNNDQKKRMQAKNDKPVQWSISYNKNNGVNIGSGAGSKPQSGDLVRVGGQSN